MDVIPDFRLTKETAPPVWGSAAIWPFHQGATGWGIFMVIRGVLVSSVDNVVKPWLISQGSAMPFLLMFAGSSAVPSRSVSSACSLARRGWRWQSAAA